MKVATTEVMRRLDQKAIQEFGIPGLVLMENAARSTVSTMFRHFSGLLTQRVGIFAGRHAGLHPGGLAVNINLQIAHQ